MEVYSSKIGAGDESRTRDLNLGKVALYQLSYSRICFYRFLCFASLFGVAHIINK